MIIGIAIHTDSEAYKKASLVNEFSELLKSEFINKSYGEDIEDIYIGFSCTRIVPGFKDFSAKRKPKYKARDRVSIFGKETVIKKTFSYDIKLDDASYELYVYGSDDESIKLLKRELIKSLT